MKTSIDQMIDDLHWYDFALLQAYFGCNKNAKRLSRETKIPYMKIWRHLNKIKQAGKSELFDHPEYFNQP